MDYEYICHTYNTIGLKHIIYVKIDDPHEFHIYTANWRFIKQAILDS